MNNSTKNYYSLITLIVTVYLCCMGLIIGNRIKINRLERKIEALEQSGAEQKIDNAQKPENTLVAFIR